MKLRPWHTLPWKHHICKVKLGDDAPNSNIVLLDGSASTMHEVVEGNKPVVLLFGSITCPSMRNQFLEEVCQIVDEFKGAVRLVFVYLAEAHPKDGWHLPLNEQQKVVVDQHTTIEERIASAKRLKETFPNTQMEVVVDSIDNNSDFHYEAQSSRIYVIYEEKIAYQSHMGPFQISPSSLQAFLWEWSVLV